MTPKRSGGSSKKRRKKLELPRVVTVRQEEDGHLKVLVEKEDDTRVWLENHVARESYKDALLRFYETHVRFE